MGKARIIGAFALMLIIGVVIGIGYVSSQKDNPIATPPPTIYFPPDTSEDVDLESWTVTRFELGPNTTVIQSQYPQTINACDADQILTYTCTGQTEGQYSYLIGLELGIGAEQPPVGFLAALTGEIETKVGQISSHEFSRSHTVERGSKKTYTITYYDVVRNGFGVAESDMEHVLEGDFTFFSGSCTIEIELTLTEPCSVLPPPTEQPQPEPTDIECCVVPIPEPRPEVTNSPDVVELGRGESFQTEGYLTVCTGDVKVEGDELYDNNQATGLVVVIQAGNDLTVEAPYGAYCEHIPNDESFNYETYSNRLLNQSGCEGVCSRVIYKIIDENGNVDQTFEVN